VTVASVVHDFVSAVADGPDPLKVNKTRWNDHHDFTGGATGALLVRDTVATGGAAWVDAVAIGRVLASAGAGVVPAWTTSPSLTALTLSTPLAPTSGGTGVASYATGDILYASATNVLSKLAAGADGNVLRAGTTPSWAKVRLSGSPNDVTGTLPADKGGTGLSLYTQGDLIVASGTTALASLPAVAVGKALVSAGIGASPVWGLINLTLHVTGVLPVANGGLGAALTLTNGDILYAASGVWANLADGGAGKVLAGGGPAWSATPQVTDLTAVGKLVVQTANAAKGEVKTASVTVNSSDNVATLTATSLIPAGALVLGVVARVVTSFGNGHGLTTFKIGDGTDDDRWGNTIARTTGTTTDGTYFTIASPVYYAAATNVVLTSIGGNFDSNGQARLTVIYVDFVGPTS
jgi:hypothetical protein